MDPVPYLVQHSKHVDILVSIGVKLPWSERIGKCIPTFDTDTGLPQASSKGVET